jgi:hypothetical protein
MSDNAGITIVICSVIAFFSLIVVGGFNQARISTQKDLEIQTQCIAAGGNWGLVTVEGAEKTVTACVLD